MERVAEARRRAEPEDPCDLLGSCIRVAHEERAELTRSRRHCHSATTTIEAIDSTGLAMRGTPNICLYDSGGPTFMKRGDVEVVVGIHSLSDTATCDGQGVDTRADPYVAFVDGYTPPAEPADAGPLEDDAGVAPERDGGDDVAKSAASTSSCSLVGDRRPTDSAAALVLVLVVALVLRRHQPGAAIR